MNFLARLSLLLTTCSFFIFAQATVTVHPPARSDYWQTLPSGRRFKIFAPGPTTPACTGTPHSVIIAFHGRGGTPNRMRDVSHFHVNAPCSIVIYPEGTPSSTTDTRRSWHPAPYADPTANDLQYVNDIIDWIDSTYAEHADMDRVYASGKSNGASIVGWLACVLSHRLAAVAPVSGPFYLAQDLTHPDPTCSPTGPVPIIEFHGTEDGDAPYAHYRSSWNGGQISTIPAWVNWWAAENGCNLTPAVTHPVGATQACRGQTTEIQTFTRCTDGVEVIHHRIEHGLHDWQSRVQNLDNTDDESNPTLWTPLVPAWGNWCPGTEDATAIILAFFNRWTL